MRTLGLDLGGTNIKTTIVDVPETGDEPTIGPSRSAPTHASAGPEGVLERMAQAVAGAQAQVAAGRQGDVDEGATIAAVGVGVPGLFDAATGEIRLFPNLPGPWPGFLLRDRLQHAVGVPVTLINDARAFTLAEGRLGAGRGCRTVACVTLGTGVGGGVIVDGRLHLGASGTAGEIGHQTVLPDGPVCGCGNRGCVEAVVQAAALARISGRSTVEAVFEGADAGDPRCQEAVETLARYLGIALANVVTVLVPDRVVIGGGISTAGDRALEPIRAAVRARTPLVPPDRIDIRAAALGRWAGAIGAALAAADASAVVGLPTSAA
jgi:glucokinase